MAILRVLGTEAAEFETHLSRDRCIERLQAAVRQLERSASATDALTGRIGKSRVVLRPARRRSRIVGRAFPTIFIGRVVATDRGAVLVGAFSLTRLAKLSLSIWFVFVAFWLANGVLSTLARGATVERLAIALLPPGILIAIAVADLIASSVRRRGDVELITRVIGAALGR